jgi:hypothetical protein
MGINLQDLRTAVQEYVRTKVTCTISPIRPPPPNTTLNTNEEFTFDVTVSNAPVTSGGIRLTNIHYLILPPLWFPIIPPRPRLFKFRTPDKLAVGTAHSLDGTQLGDKAWLDPGVGYWIDPAPAAWKTLDPGETVTINGLMGKSLDKVGNTYIRFQIDADPDMEYLFPLGDGSTTTSKSFSIT